METLDSEKPQGGIVNYFAGATIHNFVYNNHGTVYNNPNNVAGRTEEREQSPYIALLRKLVGMVDGSKPKQVLMPYKAALSISVLPLWDYSTFNSLMGTKLTRSSYSNWVNGTQGCCYTDEEIDPFVEQFKKLTQ